VTVDQRSTLSARSGALAQTTDIASTVLDRAGLAQANGMQGQSLLAVISQKQAAVRKHLVIEEEGQRADFGLSTRCRMRTLLTERYRLTLYDQQSWGELFDLQEDPHELRNLWAEPAASTLKNELGTELAYAMLNLADTSPYPSASA
jgi:arylsulfatase A-like enzyme